MLDETVSNRFYIRYAKRLLERLRSGDTAEPLEETLRSTLSEVGLSLRDVKTSERELFEIRTRRAALELERDCPSVETMGEQDTEALTAIADEASRFLARVHLGEGYDDASFARAQELVTTLLSNRLRGFRSERTSASPGAVRHFRRLSDLFGVDVSDLQVTNRELRSHRARWHAQWAERLDRLRHASPNWSSLDANLLDRMIRQHRHASGGRGLTA